MNRRGFVSAVTQAWLLLGAVPAALVATLRRASAAGAVDGTLAVKTPEVEIDGVPLVFVGEGDAVQWDAWMNLPEGPEVRQQLAKLFTKHYTLGPEWAGATPRQTRDRWTRFLGGWSHDQLRVVRRLMVDGGGAEGRWPVLRVRRARNGEADHIRVHLVRGGENQPPGSQTEITFVGRVG